MIGGQKSRGRKSGKGGKSGTISGVVIQAIQEQIESIAQGKDFVSCGGEVKEVEIPDDWVIPQGDYVLVSGSTITLNVCECPGIIISVGVVGSSTDGSSSSGKGKGNDGSTEGTCSDVSFIGGIFIDSTVPSSALTATE